MGKSNKRRFNSEKNTEKVFFHGRGIYRKGNNDDEKALYFYIIFHDSEVRKVIKVQLTVLHKYTVIFKLFKSISCFSKGSGFYIMLINIFSGMDQKLEKKLSLVIVKKLNTN